MASQLRNHLPMQKTQVQSLGQEDPLEEEIAIHCSIPVFLPKGFHEHRSWWAPLSMGWHRVRPDLMTEHLHMWTPSQTFYKISLSLGLWLSLFSQLGYSNRFWGRKHRNKVSFSLNHIGWSRIQYFLNASGIKSLHNISVITMTLSGLLPSLVLNHYDTLLMVWFMLMLTESNKIL